MIRSKYLSRRKFVHWGSATLALITFPGCAEEVIDEPPENNYTPSTTPPMIEEEVGGEITLEQIGEWESDGVLSPNDPGEWGEKIIGHYPIMQRNQDQVTVFVPHPMDEEHYIEAIYLKDDSGMVVASQRLSGTDELAFASFTVSEDISLTAYSVCNLHQVWSAPEVRTVFNPGPWSEKIIGHMPRVLIDGDQATVSAPHPMGEEHYIVGLYLTDQDGAMIGKTQLNPSDEASYTFTIPEGTTEIQPWSLCDDHDLWVGQSVSLDEAGSTNLYEMSGVLTSDEPGQWGEKIAGHYPIVSIVDQIVSVQVSHPMETDHYIEAIYLKDAEGHLLGFKSLSPGDDPSASFFVVDQSAECKAYAMCNLHEVWAAPIVRSGDRPGPWADKVDSHTPTLEISTDGLTATVSVAHPMDDEHYIVAMYLSDSSGAVIAKKQLNPQDYPEAQYTFELPEYSGSITPWALCDDHDLWIGDSVTT